jgi:putative ABC transport system permease protein
MNVLTLTWREIAYRKLPFLFSALAVTVATASLIGAMTFLDLHDRQTDRVMERKEAETRKIMDDLREQMRLAGLDLSHNLLILPKNQNLKDFYAEDYARKDMPEEYVDRLAASGIIVARHFLPSLQKRVEWPEKKRTILLVGSRGQVPNLYKDPRKPLVQGVPPQTMVLGHELHSSLQLKEGDTVQFMGRELTVHRTHPARGNQDDMTAWIYLPEAQELFDMQGRINSILALECMCPAEGVTAKEAILKILPDTQVIEMGTHILARQASRSKAGEEAQASLRRARQARADEKAAVERLLAATLPIVLAACALWVGLLAYQNAKARRFEIGLLRALGARGAGVANLLLLKALASGLIGGLVGSWLGLTGAGRIATRWGSPALTAADLTDGNDLTLLLIGLAIAVALTVVATWAPTVIAARQDPADILKGE